MRRRSEEDEKRTSLVREKLERNLDERRFVWSVGVQSWGGLAIAFVVPPSHLSKYISPFRMRDVCSDLVK